MTYAIRVLVLARDTLARAGLTTVLDERPECMVVGQASDDTDALDELEVYRPDVVVWDMGWEPSASVEGLADVSDDCDVVALLPDDSYVSEVWMSGAKGILRRDAPVDSIAAAILGADKGLMVIQPELMPALARGGERAPSPDAFALTPREVETLRLLAAGASNKTIALELDISEHTVKFHVNSIMTKLNAQNRTEAVVNAMRLGLIHL